MRYYTVEYDFLEIWSERCKRVTNVQWLGLGTTGSLVLLAIFLLCSIPQQSQHFAMTLGPYETQIVPLQSRMVFARRSIDIFGNMNATNFYWSRTCPDLEDFEQESLVERIEQGKVQKDIFLLKNSIAVLKLENANGPMEISVFASWEDEKAYERQHAKRQVDHTNNNYNNMRIIKSDTADRNRPITFEIVSQVSSSHVFLFQSRRDQSADATFLITRRRYPVRQLSPLSKMDTNNAASTSTSSSASSSASSSLSCSYQNCQIVRNSAGCVTIESTLTSRNVSIEMHVMVKQHTGWMILVSFLPLLVGLLWIKFNGKPMFSHPSSSSSYASLDQFHATRVVAGYELVSSGGDCCITTSTAMHTSDGLE